MCCGDVCPILRCPHCDTTMKWSSLRYLTCSSAISIVPVQLCLSNVLFYVSKNTPNTTERGASHTSEWQSTVGVWMTEDKESKSIIDTNWKKHIKVCYWPHLKTIHEFPCSLIKTLHTKYRAQSYNHGQFKVQTMLRVAGHFWTGTRNVAFCA